MSTQTNEAKIVVSAQDNTASAFSSVTAHFNQMTASADSLKAKLHGIGNGAFTNLTGALGTLQGKMAAIGLVSGGVALGGAAMMKSAYTGVGETAKKMLEIQQQSSKFSINTDDYQVLAKIASKTNVPIDDLGASFVKLRIKMGELAQGAKSADGFSDALEGLNISADSATAMETIDLYQKIGAEMAKATGVNGIVNEDAKNDLSASLAKSIFGKAGNNVLPALKEFGIEREKTLQMLQEQGLHFEGALIPTGANAAKAMGKAEGAMKSLQTVFAAAMMPVYAKGADIIKNRAMANREAMLPGVEAFAETLSNQLEPLLDTFNNVSKGASGIFKAISGVARLVGWDVLVLGGIGMLAAPFVVSITAATVAILKFSAGLISPVFTTLTTGIRATTLSLGIMQGATWAAWGAFLAPAAAVVAVVAAVAAGAYWIYNNWDGVASFFGGVWDSVSTAFEPIKPVFDWLGEKLGAAIGWFKELLGPVGASASGFQDWSNAGRTAGAFITTTLNGILTPIYLVIDALKLLGASWDWMVNNKDFEFNSTTFKALSKDHFAAAEEMNKIHTANSKATQNYESNKFASARFQANGGSPSAPIAGIAGIAPAAPMSGFASTAGIADAAGRNGVNGENGANSASGAVGRAMPAPAAFASVNAPVAFATPSFTIPPIPPAKVDIGGRLDVRIASDGRATVERVESTNRNYEIDARAGAMYAAGA
jgi:hypothetical protein